MARIITTAQLIGPISTALGVIDTVTDSCLSSQEKIVSLSLTLAQIKFTSKLADPIKKRLGLLEKGLGFGEEVFRASLGP